MEKMMLSNKLELITPCEIRAMTIKCMKSGAINLGQGFPDSPTIPELKYAAIDSIVKDFNQYTDMRGYPDLRNAVADHLNRRYDLSLTGEDNICITCGVTEATLAALLAIVNPPHDEIIIIEPFHENFPAQSLIIGASVRYYPLKPPEYHLNVDELESLFTKNTKAIIVNTPHNPTGRVFSLSELTGLSELCKKYGALAITDEIYEWMVFDSRKHIPLATIPGMFERTITLSGFSKTFAVTGWRVGYAVAPKYLADAIRRTHDYITGVVPTPFQRALVQALNLPDSYFRSVTETYEKRRNMICAALKDIGFNVSIPEGTYYVMADFTPFGFDDDDTFVEFMLNNIGVGVVKGSAFYHEGNKYLGKKSVRFTYSKTLDTINEAIDRMQKLIRI